MKAALFEGVQGGTWRATVGVIVFDSELRYVVWNPFMEQFMGVSARDVIGKRTIHPPVARCRHEAGCVVVFSSF